MWASHWSETGVENLRHEYDTGKLDRDHQPPRLVTEAVCGCHVFPSESLASHNLICHRMLGSNEAHGRDAQRCTNHNALLCPLWQGRDLLPTKYGADLSIPP